jgi:hypothetical protein
MYFSKSSQVKSSLSINNRQPYGSLSNVLRKPAGEDGSGGIGGIFYTRKGNFLYKISLYIIIYLDYIIVYHVYHSLVSQPPNGFSRIPPVWFHDGYRPVIWPFHVGFTAV